MGSAIETEPQSSVGPWQARRGSRRTRKCLVRSSHAWESGPLNEMDSRLTFCPKYDTASRPVPKRRLRSNLVVLSTVIFSGCCCYIELVSVYTSGSWPFKELLRHCEVCTVAAHPAPDADLGAARLTDDFSPPLPFTPALLEGFCFRCLMSAMAPRIQAQRRGCCKPGRIV